jgi:hypothetical protein
VSERTPNPASCFIGQIRFCRSAGVAANAKTLSLQAAGRANRDSKRVYVHIGADGPGTGPGPSRPVCYEALVEDRREFLVFRSFVSVWAALMTAMRAWSTCS